MKQAFTNTHVAEMMAKVTVPWVILLTYSCAFATSFWVQAGENAQHWGLWTHCSTDINNVNASEACVYWDFGESDAYFETSRFLAPLPFLCYIILLFQISLMELVVCKGQIGPCIAYLGALINVLILITVGSSYKDDSHWKNKDPSLGWSFWCAVPSALVAILDGLAMSYAAHKRRYPYGKRSPRRRTRAKTYPAAADNTATDAKELAGYADKMGKWKSTKHERGCEEDGDVWRAGTNPTKLDLEDGGARNVPARTAEHNGKNKDGQKGETNGRASLKPIRGTPREPARQTTISQLAHIPETENSVPEATCTRDEGKTEMETETSISMHQDRENITEKTSQPPFPRSVWLAESETSIRVSKRNQQNHGDLETNSEDDERGLDRGEEGFMAQQQQRFQDHLNELYCLQESQQKLED